MKNLTFTLLLLGFFSGLSAQYVTIPDANFRAELIQRYPSCFNANQEMDTTCSAVVNEAFIGVSYLQISNLDGIQYFDNLQTLYCNNLQLTTIPALPDRLNTFRCQNNQLTRLPVLPSNLTMLSCENNQLTTLPALPNSLTYISCSNNLITSLPTLPSLLNQLHCQGNQLTSLPTLPFYIEYLYCYANQLSSLPALPYSLMYLRCYNNQLTSLPAPQSRLVELTCYNNRLTSLPTLSIGLRTITCNNNQITSLPPLPYWLRTLECSNNQISTLPALPAYMEQVSCSNNQLTILPALPNSLTSIYCSNNRLTSLPTLPSSLTNIDCSSNGLMNIPTIPSGLVGLNCNQNQVRILPMLPNSLQFLSCAGNFLQNLPPFQNNLNSLNCSNNQLVSLPNLPSNLRDLNCSNNHLTSLPALPNSLTYLYCSDNQISRLPSLPSNLWRFECSNNRYLYCLPPLPSNLGHLIVTNTRISCLPNYTISVNQFNSSIPLCSSPAQTCQINPNLIGIIYNDANNNGTRNAQENQVGGIPIVVSPNNYIGLSDTINGFGVILDTLPVINIISVSNVPYRAFSPSSYSVTTTSLGLLPGSYDFAMQVTQPNITDLVAHISTWFIRPGFTTSANINVVNIGTIDQTNASISLEVPNGLTVISTYPTNGVVTGNTVTWSGESIAIFERKSYSVSLQVPATMPLGTSLTYTAQAIPANTDFTPADNIATQEVTVRGSYDPNDKLVNKDRLPNNYVAADEEMLYTIRFQNTGTDTAFTVLIRDTLDLQKLDFSTFRVTGASHALRTNVRERGVVEFVFNNIMLPDSFVNEPLSHGYVQFRIHPKANLPLGTQIKNRAFIYFDFNTPIITNFATTTVGLLSITGAELGAGSLSLYPVPVAEQLTVNFNAVRSGEVRYRLLDIQGRVLQEQQLTVTEGENISTMDMSKLGAGMYLLQVVGEQGSLSQKIVKN